MLSKAVLQDFDMLRLQVKISVQVDKAETSTV
jgi:hypothetical protein